jgi:hypothetical protein
MNVLVVNSGSSSLKFQVIATDLDRIKEHKDDRICRGEIEGIGGEAIFHFSKRNGAAETLTAPLRDTSAAQWFGQEDHRRSRSFSGRSQRASTLYDFELFATKQLSGHGGEGFAV